MNNPPHKPVVLCLSGHDPSGGAGIQADIEAIFAHGCHAATAITCLTVQDSKSVYDLRPVEASLFSRQARAVLEDAPVAAIKIGLLGSEEIALAVAAILQDHPQLPVVLDPVLSSGGDGNALSTFSVESIIRDRLLPFTDLLTPNSAEAEQLAGMGDDHKNAQKLLDLGCKAVLITGGDSELQTDVLNRLFLPDSRIDYQWPRLEGRFHGSGCTLAASCTANLALGNPLKTAVKLAQSYTEETLSNAFRAGSGQAIPNRLIA